jgi:hypothetical protein
MNNQLYVPTLLKVGFQKREDTYTGKLGFVTYYDQKNVLRKEKSWKDWCSKKLGSQEFENKSIEGFVINRNGGGKYEYSNWEERMEFVRVYDPRGFEFEIKIPNLLFILTESNSIKGKGLEGEFVYAWRGTELILLPTSSQQYKNSIDFTVLQGKKINKTELTPGCTYCTKKQKDVVYMGQFDWHTFCNNYKSINQDESEYVLKTTKQHVFISFAKKKPVVGILKLNTLATQISDTPVTNFAQLMTLVSRDKHLSKIDSLIAKPAKLSIKSRTYGSPEVTGGSYKLINGKYVNYNLSATDDYSSKNAKGLTAEPSGNILTLNENKELHVARTPYNYGSRPRRHTLEELQEMEFFDVYVKLQNGTSLKAEIYMDMAYDDCDLNNIYEEDED